MANEIQSVTFTPAPDGGVFTLTFDGDTTAAIDWDATSGEIVAALEALGSIGSGNVQVNSWDGTTLVVEFIGALANADQPEMTCDDSGLTKATGTTIGTPTPAVQEVQRITFGAIPHGGKFFVNGVEVANSFDFSGNDIESALYTANTITTHVGYGGDGSPADVTYDACGPVDDDFLDFTGTTLWNSVDPGLSVVIVQEGGGGDNEVQRIVTPLSFDGGTWTLLFNGAATAEMAHDIATVDLQAALNALISIGGQGASVSVTGSTFPYEVEFLDAFADTDVPLMVAQAGSTTPVHHVPIDPSVSTTTQGTLETQAVAFLDAATNAGDVVLDCGSPSASDITFAWDADAASVEAAFSGKGITVVVDDSTPGTWSIQFQAPINPDQLTDGGSTLTKPVSADVDTTQEGGDTEFTGDAEVTTAAATCSGSGTFTAPVYSGSASLTCQAATCAASGTFTAPVYSGSADLTTSAATCAASGAFVAPVYTGSADLITQAVTCSATGAHAAPVYTGTAALTCSAATSSGAGCVLSGGAPVMAAGTAWVCCPVAGKAWVLVQTIGGGGL